MDTKPESNRRNARRSTGPRTPTGKRKSSCNAFKHGLAISAPASGARVKGTAELVVGQSN